MSRSWFFSEQFDEIAARVRRCWAGTQPAITPQAILLAITVAMGLLSAAQESFLLFLLTIMQGAVIYQLLSSDRNGKLPKVSATLPAVFAKMREQLPNLESVRRVSCQVAILIVCICYRLMVCLLISLAAGMATLSAFVLKQADLWQWRTLQTSGPPLGPMLATGAIVLFVLLLSGWVAIRRPLLPR